MNDLQNNNTVEYDHCEKTKTNVSFISTPITASLRWNQPQMHFFRTFLFVTICKKKTSRISSLINQGWCQTLSKTLTTEHLIYCMKFAFITDTSWMAQSVPLYACVLEANYDSHIAPHCHVSWTLSDESTCVFLKEINCFCLVCWHQH